MNESFERWFDEHNEDEQKLFLYIMNYTDRPIMIVNALFRAGIRSVEDLKTKPIEDFASIRIIGPVLLRRMKGIESKPMKVLKPKELYLVTHDGYREGYGSAIYVVGIFDDLAKAEEKVKELGPEFTTLTTLDLNETYPLSRDRWENMQNEKYLGGYAE